MYRTGHYGAALLVYAPLGFLLLAAGYETLALAGALIAMGGSMIPDWDHKLPFLSHRGFTHTVWFAVLVGLAMGGGGWLLGGTLGAQARIGLAAFGFLSGALTIGAHILADALTPMGVRPFAPLGSGTCSFDVTRAGNPIGNGLLFVLGVLVAGGAFLAGREFTVTVL